MRSNRAKISPPHVKMFQRVNIKEQTGTSVEYYEFPNDIIVCIKVNNYIVLQSYYRIQAKAVQKYHATIKLLRKNELTLEELKEKFLETSPDKFIELSDSQIAFVRFAMKLDKYPRTGNAIQDVIPLYKEIYLYDEDNPENIPWKQNLFNILLDIYLKIQTDKSGSNKNLKEIIGASVDKNYSTPQSEPVDRMISKLFSLISVTRIAVDGNPRFPLKIS